MSDVTPNEARRLLGIQLNALHSARVWPEAILEGGTLEAGTPIYDINGQVLFYRFPLRRDALSVGYADAAAQTALGAPLLAVAPEAPWDPHELLSASHEQFLNRAQRGLSPNHFDEMRFVAYSYPKIAIQYLHEGKEILMLECYTWIEVPPALGVQAMAGTRRPLEPSNFERWSLLDELPKARAEENNKQFEQQAKALDDLKIVPSDVNRISKAAIDQARIVIPPISVSWELHYSGRSADHHPCFELRAQETPVWCVGASVQMVLDFYRYNYTQTKIAQQLGLGTPTNPNGLPYARVGDVVTQLQVMSSNALSAHMITSPTFNDFVAELRQNRPMISFIPGHSRAVAGYMSSLLPIPGGFRGLLVYDPWPPAPGGTVWRYENFAAQIYQYAFAAHVTTIP